MTTLILKPLFIVIVSHDSSFLNNTITDVLHLNRFKLRRYRGNLENFVQQVPEAKSYYTLEAQEDYKFRLPDPPLLEGVKIKEKSLLRCKSCVTCLRSLSHRFIGARSASHTPRQVQRLLNSTTPLFKCRRPWS